MRHQSITVNGRRYHVDIDPNYFEFADESFLTVYDSSGLEVTLERQPGVFNKIMRQINFLTYEEGMNCE